MSIKFRSMNVNDKDEVLNMMREFYNSAAVYTNGSDEIFLRDFDNCVSDSPYLEGYIFESEGRVCGYSMTAKSFSTEFGKQCIWIEDIFIKESFRGRGIGKAFFELLERKYTDVIFRLEAEKENSSAIGLYKREGFDFLPYLEMKK